ncbi:hypothetical protein [Olsenella sp. HMSC062G07]|uniref:hypothetical protein n=1 Tax=Olsenella sp. HMSC062G07 TaxID=1739330 RepID=UPI0011D06F9B|nr:hypothetical protein [Olsenella sp. HMSC062G07]
MALAVVTTFCTYVARELKDFRGEHKVLLESQRNQLKASIVSIFERAKGCDYITAMELDTLDRMADSYFALGGNHYMHALIRQANELEIRGEVPR